MDKNVENYFAFLTAFIEANRKLAEGLVSLDGFADDDIKALETLGQNAVIIRDLLYK